MDFPTGRLGMPLPGMTVYMFDPGILLFARGLSSFHAWLPFVLVFLVARRGYDKRALVCRTVLAWVLMAAARLFLPGPLPDPAHPDVPVNINQVDGFGDAAAQTWMPDRAWLALLLASLPLRVFWPTHALLERRRG